MALTDSAVKWIVENPNTEKIYHEIMGEVMNKCTSVVLQSELIWLFKTAGTRHAYFIRKPMCTRKMSTV